MKKRLLAISVALLALAAIIIFLSYNITPTFSVSNDTLRINLNGYVIPCMRDEPVVSVNENGVWRNVSQLPNGGGYYLDGRFYEANMGCDVMSCDYFGESTYTYDIRLEEFRKSGEKAPPAELNGTFNYPALVPEYDTVPLSGEIKVELKYYQDRQCRNESRVFSTVIFMP